MKHINLLKYIVLFLVFTTCIKPFEPVFKDDSIQKYVVQGMVSSKEGWQEVTVSLSSSTSNPEFIPVNDCHIEIIDGIGNVFKLRAFSDGKYRVWMTLDELVVGRAYKVKVQTPTAEVLQSAFDEMPDGSQVDDVFYEIEMLPTNNPEEFITGIQFYTNLYSNDSQSRHYRWQISETWEYHAAYPLEFYYDGDVHQVIPPDYSQMYCWITKDIDEIYVLSTEGLNENTSERIPLNYVDNTTRRLVVMYSLNIRQIALSRPAYVFWEKLQANSNAEGGLYTSQPLPIKGNIINLNHPEKDVLGFFQASTVRSKRIFVGPVEGLEMKNDNGCSERELLKGLSEIGQEAYPAFLMSVNGNWMPTVLSESCVDCTSNGGTTQQPEFWPTNYYK